MFTERGEVRPHYQCLYQRLLELSKEELLRRKAAAEKALVSLGITFNTYQHGNREETVLPFDIIPRIVSAKEWGQLERGLRQRIYALNLFVQDIYAEKKILKDGIIEPELIYSSPGYLKPCEGLRPPRGIWIHICGTDLVRHQDGSFYVLEDNLRVPSGVSYVLENREIMKRTFPEVFERLSVRPVSDYPMRLRSLLHYLSGQDNSNVVVLTPGIYNSAYFEHSFLAQQMGVELVVNTDLIVHDGEVKARTTRGLKKVDVIYRRTDDTFLDPLVFRPDSLLGIPGIFEVYRRGKVALANALGTGIADDKVIYAYVPKIIRYYLNEEPIIPNVETYVCVNEKECQYVLDNIEKLVVKSANMAGGYGMLIGPHSSQAECEKFKELIRKNPRNYIAQPVISLSRIPTITEESFEGRHVDLRPFVLYGEDIYVMPGGLTRVALRKGSLVVNSSQGGGSKDTWVPAETYAK
ncbi:MAG: circularly permuted type 2 ATP-grasp protein [Leptospiraceae bacterium]|nr:circularly permuted type 2 ATP-grasp protein [Leptospiraceae bacterium]MDW8306663.1 circularly permuted type 2 ATP-grasp protein [Leptospiraceae bacterium]